MRTASLVGAALAALGAGEALAQPRTPPALLSARQDLRECIIRNAGWASARAEATPDTVADAAASKCEGQVRQGGDPPSADGQGAGQG